MSFYRVMVYEDSWDDDPAVPIWCFCRPLVGDEIKYDPEQNFDNVATQAMKIIAVRHIINIEGEPMLAVLVERMPE